MNKITIGLPRALLYYRYKTLWLEFFKELDVKVVISPKTNKEIIEQGTKYVVDEACLSLKIFMGHVDYLKDKVDYILVPRISCLRTNEKVCTNFLALYDLVCNLFSDSKFLTYNVDVEEKEYEIDGFIKLGKELGFPYITCLNAYKNAKRKEKEYYKHRVLIQDNKLKENNLKILVIAHQYNLYDDFVGKQVIKYLEKENITVLTSDIYYNNYKEINCNDISKTLYWTFNKELMSAACKYKDQIDGIVLITTFPCGPDSLSNELIIRKVKSVPILYLTFDNNSSDTGLITRLESFIDIIKINEERRTKNEETFN